MQHICLVVSGDAAPACMPHAHGAVIMCACAVWVLLTCELWSCILLSSACVCYHMLGV